MDRDTNKLIAKMRDFFSWNAGLEQVFVQQDTTILAACEDPPTVVPVELGEKVWPLPQTGQMRLEEWLLTNPEDEGFFCITTSYRNEPVASFIEGRHKRVFPLFEFETKGGMDHLIELEKRLLFFLGFEEEPVIMSYDEACEDLGVDLIEAEQELQLQKRYGNIIFLTHFPKRSHPFWNMKQMDEDLFAKVDVILYGQETIGSAERSCSVDQMRHMFDTIPGYKDKLYELFGEERTEEEMREYLEHDFITRCGGGIGVSRMLRACKLAGLM